MATSSRKTALTALSEVTENEGYSNIVIDKAIRAAELSPRDAALASTIFYGVLEKRLTLDFYIRKFLAKPKQKLDGTVLNILRIAVYQMMYLDRVPDSAAVNEAVLCAAEYRRGQYKNFVNGVLRSFARGWHEVIISEDDLSVRYNIPQPIIESFKKDYGETVCIDLLKAMSERAETYIRINPLKTTVDDLIQSLPENTAEKAVLQNALCGRQIPCAGSFFAAFVCVCFTAARRAACGCLCSAGRQELHACGIHGKHRRARCVRFIQRPREPHQKRRGEIRLEPHSRRRARCRDRCV